MGRREFIALVCAGITWWQRWNFIDADRDVARLERVPPHSNRGDSARARGRRVYRH